MIALKYSMASKHEILQGRALGGLMGCESSASFFFCVCVCLCFCFMSLAEGSDTTPGSLSPHLSPAGVTTSHSVPKSSAASPGVPALPGGGEGAVEVWGMNKGLKALLNGDLWSWTQKVRPLLCSRSCSSTRHTSRSG